MTPCGLLSHFSDLASVLLRIRVNCKGDSRAVDKIKGHLVRMSRSARQQISKIMQPYILLQFSL